MSSNEKEVSSSLRMKAPTEIRLSLKRKRQEINIAILSSIKKRKHKEPRTGATNTMRRTTDVNLPKKMDADNVRVTHCCSQMPLKMTAFQLMGWKLYAQTVTRKITFCCIPVRLRKKGSLDVYTPVKDIAIWKLSFQLLGSLV